MEGKILIAHATNRTATVKQTLEVSADVRRPISVSIERKHAVSLCATPQSANLFLHFCLLFLPWSAWTKAAAACFRGVCFRGGCYHEASRQLTHQPDTDARWVASIASSTCTPGDHAPRTVRKYEWANISLFPDAIQPFVQAFFRLLCLDRFLPSPLSKIKVGIECETYLERLVPLGTVSAESNQVSAA